MFTTPYGTILTLLKYENARTKLKVTICENNYSKGLK